MITFRRAHLDAALEAAKPLMKGRVLDVGGRKGVYRGTFRPPKQGVDKWEYLNLDPNAEPDLIGSAESIPLPDGCVDTVVMTEVLEYVIDCRKALDEIHRVLKAGGACLISTPLVMAIHGDWEWDRQRFTRVKLLELSGECGFASVDVQEMGSLGSVIYDLLQAYFGYASGARQTFGFKLARFLLPLTRLAFGWVDGKSSDQRKYISTGYFVTLKKG